MTIPADQAAVTRTAVPAITLTLAPLSPDQAARMARPAGEWTVGDVCAYVTEEMARIHGAQLPGGDPEEILASFCERRGIPQAALIARTAFEIYNGMWYGAPITIKRFTEGHDSFFSDPIVAEHG